MAIITERRFVPLTDAADPDDWRPNSRIAAVVDPARPDGAFVHGLVVLWEVLAPAIAFRFIATRWRKYSSSTRAWQRSGWAMTLRRSDPEPSSLCPPGPPMARATRVAHP